MHARVAALASMIAATTGNRPRIETTEHGVRIEADVPDVLSPTARTAILVALAAADRYGHVRTEESSAIWAEITEGKPVGRTNDHCAGCDECTDNAVAVAIEHANSGPGRTLYACPRCREKGRLLPLDEHPKDSWGLLQRERAVKKIAPLSNHADTEGP
ncbi:hypothetical protein [Streptomyces sp. NPDC059256]|uniref:hypothetical protein n=1 Tax=Streptomyces sp. NPDC059256 TaxID=3346794 RepID=UPI0036AD7DA3